VASLSLAEKVGQMTQLDCVMFVVNGSTASPDIDLAALENVMKRAMPGSMFNNQMKPLEWVKFLTTIQKSASAAGVLPVLYGLDSVHGANFVYGATLFPHHIGAAASFNPSLWSQEAQITAKDTRAVGIPWMFSPVLGIAQHPAWPRVYETCGEDPHVASMMAKSYISACQGGNGSDLACNSCVAATMKHFLGYSAPRSGKDRTTAWIPTRYLYGYFVPSFVAAVEAGARTTMINSGDINGVPVHSSKDLVSDLLRGNVVGFPSSGVAVSDYQDLEKLVFYHRVAATIDDAIVMGLNAGLDMSMVATDFTFGDTLLKLVASGRVAESRLDVSVGRILQLKKDVGLLATPMPDPSNPLLKSIGQPSDRLVALQSVHESVTLLKNSASVLPLDRSKLAKVLVTGPAANSSRRLNGGWSIHWQGATDEEFLFGTTIYQGVQSYVQSQFIQGVDIDHVLDDRSDAISAAQSSDVVIVAVGEDPYAEVLGDIASLDLPAVQQQFVLDLAATGTPVVVVLVEGRPRTLGQAVVDAASAILMAYLPGSEGGQGIADVLFGTVNPSGRLPMTYPSAGNDICQYYHTWAEPCTPQWPFGYGLSFTNFALSNITLSTTKWVRGQQSTLTASVSVTNIGSRSGQFTVMFFLSDLVATVSPAGKLLKHFEKVMVAPNSSTVVQWEITEADLAFYGVDNQPVVEDGDFTVSVPLTDAGKPQQATFAFISR
jgi:beta-glucosidase